MARFGQFQGLKIFTLVAAVASSCGGEGDLDDDTAVLRSAITAENALTSNALTSNALTSNALTSNALTSNALTSNALTSNALTSNALRDPLARELLKYVVSCALDEDDKLVLRIDGRRYVFEGSLGLAREWGRERGSSIARCGRTTTSCVVTPTAKPRITATCSSRGSRGSCVWRRARTATNASVATRWPTVR
jgi:hypothetical protein